MFIESKFIPDDGSKEAEHVWGVTHYGDASAYEVNVCDDDHEDEDDDGKRILLVHILRDFTGAQVLMTKRSEDDPVGQLNIERLGEDDVLCDIDPFKPFELEMISSNQVKGRLVIRNMGSTLN